MSITLQGSRIFQSTPRPKSFWDGCFARDARGAASHPQAFDHDFPTWADGVLIPHGIYDPARNRGHINLGLSHDTSQFACDSLKWYWNRIGRQCYPDARSILLLFDCGGSNAAAKHIVKYDLQLLSDSIGIPIRVAHYPSNCSKYNPIERRLFPHVTRACTGMLFDTLDRAVELMRNTSTRTGLATTVNVIRRVYETGRNATTEMKQLIQRTMGSPTE